MREHRSSKTTGLTKAVLLGGVAAASLAFTAAPAFAQDDGTGLEEIVVTARRVGESLDTVPLAVTAFSAKNLEAQNIKGLADISRNTPGLSFNQQTGGGSGRNDRSSNNLYFRGFTGLLFLDGAPVSGNVPPNIREIERVEVLKGPQSVYFGRATFTGAINFVSKDPSTTEYSASIRGDVGTFGSYEGGLTVNIPVIADKLGIRISGNRQFEGGQYRNAEDINQVLGDRSTTSLSAQILFQPFENLKIKAFGSLMELVDGPNAATALTRRNGGLNCNLGGTFGPYYCGELPTNIPSQIIGADYSISPSEYVTLFEQTRFPYVFDPHWHTKAGLRRQLITANVRTDWTIFGGWNVSTISSYTRDKNQNNLDLTFTPTRGIPNTFFGNPAFPTAPATPKWILVGQGDSYNWFEELRINTPDDWRIRATAGASYFYNDVPLSGMLPGITAFGLTANGTQAESHISTPGIFGALYFDILENLTLTAEGRYQWDNISQHVLSNTQGARIAAPYFNAVFKSFAPRVSLDWNFAPNSTAYALFSRAYRPGGFNAALATATPAAQATAAALGAGLTFDQEQLDNYEAGVKTRFWDNKASIRGSAYMSKYKDGQVSSNILINNPNGTTNLIGVTQNLGTADLWGLEIEGEVNPLQGLTLSGTFGLTDTKVTQSNCNECVLIFNNVKGSLGKQLPNVARIMYSMSASYEHALWGDYTGFMRADYRYRGKMFGDAGNIQWSAPAKNLDLRLGMRTDTFTIEGYVTNLFNNKSTFGFQGTDIVLQPLGGSHVRLGLPDLRRAGVRASYNF